MEYSSTVRFESTVCPGVAYKLHKPSYGRVLAFDRDNADFREKARKLNKQSRELQDELEAQRVDWTRAQEARRKEAEAAGDAATIARIDAGFEYERLLDLAQQRGPSPEQRTELVKQILSLPLDRDAFKLDSDIVDQIRELREQSDTLVAEKYNPQRVKFGLASLEGLTIDGLIPTAELLVSIGPQDLVREILVRIEELASMTPEELRNFEQPSTLSAAEPKAESTTTATAA